MNLINKYVLMSDNDYNNGRVYYNESLANHIIDFCAVVIHFLGSSLYFLIFCCIGLYIKLYLIL